MTKNILLVGVGGQGILLAAKITAAAAEIAGYDVTTHEIHGMAQRGGSVTAQIRFGTKVHSPLIIEGEADVLGALEAIEALRYAHYLRKNALAAISAQQIIPVTVSSGRAVYPADVETRLAEVFSNFKYLDCPGMAEQLGNAKLANTILLGALSNGLTLPVEAWEQAIAKCVKPRFVDANKQAFHAGREL